MGLFNNSLTEITGDFSEIMYREHLAESCTKRPSVNVILRKALLFSFIFCPYIGLSSSSIVISSDFDICVVTVYFYCPRCRFGAILKQMGGKQFHVPEAFNRFQ